MSPLILSVVVKPVTFRLKRPFVTAGGRKTRTHNLRIELRLSNGLRGHAEASTSIAMKEQTPEKMTAAIRRAEAVIRGKPVSDYPHLTRAIWRHIGSTPTAAAALECALWDAAATFHKTPLWKLMGLGPGLRPAGATKKIKTDLTLSVATPDEVARAAKSAWAQGFRRLKVKLSGDPRVDWVRLKAVRSVAPRARIVADGNQGFDLKGALDLAMRLQHTGVRIEFFEQPFHRLDLRSMSAFRRRCRLPLWADESVRSLADARRLIRAGAVDGLNIKVAKTGLLESLAIIRLARRHKIKLGIGCMEESKLGLAASVHLACGTGAFDWVDLDSAHLIKGPQTAGGFTMKGPRLTVTGTRPGIGIA